MNEKTITSNELSEYVKEIKDFLERIIGEEDIKRLAHPPPREITENTLTVELRPSNSGTEAYTISYTVPGKGIPVEIVLNYSLNYARIIIKSKKEQESYERFAYDPLGNMVQQKKMPLNLKNIQSELELLIKK